MEVALYLPNNDGSAVLPVTSNVRRTLLCATGFNGRG
jgi:hypothetical protein